MCGGSGVGKKTRQSEEDVAAPSRGGSQFYVACAGKASMRW